MTKTPTDYIEEIRASLRIIEHSCAHIYNHPDGWQNIAVQLNKLLLDRSSDIEPLLLRVIPEPFFHPTRNPVFKSDLNTNPGRVAYKLRSFFRFEMSGNSIAITAFEVDEEPIPLERWLDLVLIEIDSTPLSVFDFIKWPRNKIAAHSNSKVHALAEAAKRGMTAHIGDKTLDPLPMAIALIGLEACMSIKQSREMFA